MRRTRPARVPTPSFRTRDSHACDGGKRTPMVLRSPDPSCRTRPPGQSGLTPGEAVDTAEALDAEDSDSIGAEQLGTVWAASRELRRTLRIELQKCGLMSSSTSRSALSKFSRRQLPPDAQVSDIDVARPRRKIKPVMEPIACEKIVVELGPHQFVLRHELVHAHGTTQPARLVRNGVVELIVELSAPDFADPC